MDTYKKEITVNIGFGPPVLSFQGSFSVENTIKELSKRIDNAKLTHFEKILRSSECSPPIKGEVTKGKLKWRGIRLVKRNRCTHDVYYLEQRGVKIGESFVVSMLIPNIS